MSPTFAKTLAQWQDVHESSGLSLFALVIWTALTAETNSIRLIQGAAAELLEVGSSRLALAWGVGVLGGGGTRGILLAIEWFCLSDLP